jgi:hypothetical protein
MLCRLEADDQRRVLLAQQKGGVFLPLERDRDPSR